MLVKFYVKWWYEKIYIFNFVVKFIFNPRMHGLDHQSMINSFLCGSPDNYWASEICMILQLYFLWFYFSYNFLPQIFQLIHIIGSTYGVLLRGVVMIQAVFSYSSYWGTTLYCPHCWLVGTAVSHVRYLLVKSQSWWYQEGHYSCVSMRAPLPYWNPSLYSCRANLLPHKNMQCTAITQVLPHLHRISIWGTQLFSTLLFSKLLLSARKDCSISDSDTTCTDLSTQLLQQ